MNDEQINNDSAIKEVHYVGFWARVAASLLDSIWLYGIIYAVLYFMYKDDLFTLDHQYTITQFMLEYIVPLIVVMAFWIIKAATPGKMLLKMKIVDAKTLEPVSKPRLLVRYLSYFIAMLPLFLGIFWVGWDSKKQGWHDKIAGTVVIKE